MIIVGIDFSKDNKKCGIAIAEYIENKLILKELGARSETMIALIESYMENSCGIIAIDAPLGWPISLGKSLSIHNAGELIDESANLLFRRKTDEIVKQITGKQSLDVGADKIARTAHGALLLLNELRLKTNNRIPMALSVGEQNAFVVIEVYPAATLKQYCMRYEGYKEKEREQIRAEMIEKLTEIVELTAYQKNNCIQNDNLLDAIVCILAGVDFIKGDVIVPENSDLARKEGWIWVKKSTGSCALD